MANRLIALRDKTKSIRKSSAVQWPTELNLVHSPGAKLPVGVAVPGEGVQSDAALDQMACNPQGGETAVPGTPTVRYCPWASRTRRRVRQDGSIAAGRGSAAVAPAPSDRCSASAVANNVPCPAGFVPPSSDPRGQTSAGPAEVHQIKHDRYRLEVRRAGTLMRLFTRRGFRLVRRSPAIQRLRRSWRPGQPLPISSESRRGSFGARLPRRAANDRPIENPHVL